MIIHKALRPALCALGLCTTCVHAASGEGAPPPNSATSPIEYRSVFDDYRAYRDPSIADWRSSNDTVGRLKGHAGHLGAPESDSATGTGKPPARLHHGGPR